MKSRVSVDFLKSFKMLASTSSDLFFPCSIFLFDFAGTPFGFGLANLDYNFPCTDEGLTLVFGE